jgi:hypothetical protein
VRWLPGDPHICAEDMCFVKRCDVEKMLVIYCGGIFSELCDIEGCGLNTAIL